MGTDWETQTHACPVAGVAGALEQAALLGGHGVFSALAQVNSHLDSCTEWRGFCPAELQRSCLCAGATRVMECCFPVCSAGFPLPSGSPGSEGWAGPLTPCRTTLGQ